MSANGSRHDWENCVASVYYRYAASHTAEKMKYLPENRKYSLNDKFLTLKAEEMEKKHCTAIHYTDEPQLYNSLKPFYLSSPPYVNRQITTCRNCSKTNIWLYIASQCIYGKAIIKLHAHVACVAQYAFIGWTSQKPITQGQGKKLNRFLKLSWPGWPIYTDTQWQSFFLSHDFNIPYFSDQKAHRIIRRIKRNGTVR